MKATLTRFGAGATPGVTLVGAGAINGLAFNPWQLWSFLRAELTAFTASPFRGASGERLTMATLRTLHPQSVGVERLVPIGLRLLDEALPWIASMDPAQRVALVLCLPSRMADGGGRTWPQQRRILERELAAHLAAALHLRGSPDPAVRALPCGHASLAFAMEELGPAMERGLVDVALVLGLDTPHDPAWVEDLIAQRRVFDADSLEAPIMGEGGALLVMATREAARRNGWPRLADLTASATAREAATVDNDVPILGLALSRCAVAATDALEAAGRTLDWWISDLTPEPDRVQEFQLAWPRAAARRMPTDATLDFLAPQLGDLGAATMPTAVALALEGLSRGAPRADTCLVTGSSPTGERGVALIERAR